MAGAESSVARKPLFMLSSSVAARISCSAISHLHNDARTSGGGRRAASADNADWQASAKPVIFSAERYHAASLRSWERPFGHAALAVVRVALRDSAGVGASLHGPASPLGKKACFKRGGSFGPVDPSHSLRTHSSRETQQFFVF